MAAPRATQFIALRNLSRSAAQQQVRSLHMTGPATYASPMLARAHERSTNLPTDTAGLRTECKRRRLDSTGSSHELIKRLHANDLAHSRAFSSAAAIERTPAQTSSPSSQPVRHFNTSRALKAVNDSSTIDFAYLPSAGAAQDVLAEGSMMRMPLLPDTELTRSALEAAAAQAAESEMPVMKPQINAANADAVILPMAELSDDHAMHVDFHDLADLVASRMRSIRQPVEDRVGLVRQVWGDIVDDVLGIGQDRKMPRSAA